MRAGARRTELCEVLYLCRCIEQPSFIRGKHRSVLRLDILVVTKFNSVHNH
jgi:hypothetical protein